MSVVKVSFTFPEETLMLLRREVPARERSAFVARRIEENLRRKKLSRAVKDTYGLLRGSGPEEWRTEKSTRDWLRKKREADTEEIKKLWK